MTERKTTISVTQHQFVWVWEKGGEMERENNEVWEQITGC